MTAIVAPPVPAFYARAVRRAAPSARAPPPPRPRAARAPPAPPRPSGRRTEEPYVAWIRRYIFFHGKRHPAEMGAPEITRFLSSLAVDGRGAASTQNQALSALLS